MNYKKLVEDTAINCYCSDKDLPEMIMYELKRMGLKVSDLKECSKEIEVLMEDKLRG